MLKLFKDLREMTLCEKWGVIWACIEYTDSELAAQYYEAFLAAPGRTFKRNIMRLLSSEGHIPELIYALLSVAADSISREDFENSRIASEEEFNQAVIRQSAMFEGRFIY